LDLLNDSDVWIADGGCSIHCTGYQHGMINVIMHGHSGGEGYAQPDGSESKTISTGDMPVTYMIYMDRKLLIVVSLVSIL
jgi:hypothetical protein